MQNTQQWRDQTQQPRRSSNFNSMHSYTSSSDDSHGRVESVPRTGNSVSEKRYEDLGLRAPPSKVLLDEFTRSELNGNDRHVSKTRTLRTARGLSNNDPMAMHLLVEMAIGDSRRYEVLSVEELVELNKELASLALRIEGGKRKLLLEIKVKKAAQSLSRLAPKQRNGEDSDQPHHRRLSVLSSFRTSSDGARNAIDQSERHLAVSTRQCEELAQDLWRLERRQTELQEQKLRHTAAILQMSYELQSQETSGGHDEEFNDINLVPYDTFDSPDGIMDIPKRRTILESELHQHTDALKHTQAGLQAIHEKLQDMIKAADADGIPRNVEPINENVNGSGNPSHATITDYLDSITHDLHQVQSVSTNSSFKGRLEGVNTTLHIMIGDLGLQDQPMYPPPPLHGTATLESEFSYLNNGLYTLKELHSEVLRSLQELHVKDHQHILKKQQTQSVLTDLWKTLLVQDGRTSQGQPGITRTSGGWNDDQAKESISDDGLVLNQDFSLPAFATKIQQLCNRATALARSQIALSEQLAQERLNHHEARDAVLAGAAEHEQTLAVLQEVQNKHEVAQSAVTDSQAQLTSMKSDLDRTVQEMADARDQLMIKHSDALNAERETRKLTEQNLTAQLMSVKHELNQAKQEMTETKDQLNLSHANALSTEREARQLSEKELTTQLNDELVHVSNLEKAIVKYASDLESALSAHRETESLHALARDEIEQKDAMLSQFKTREHTSATRLQATETKLQEQVAKVLAVEAAHGEIERLLAMAQDELLQKDKSLSRLQESESTSMARLEATETSYQDAVSKLDKAGAAHQASSDQIERMLAERQSLEDEVTHLSTELTAVRVGLEAEFEANRKQFDEVEREKLRLETEVVRLQTEATAVRAELAEAHGSLAQRTAETAIIPETMKDLEAARTQKDEVEATLQELRVQKEDAEQQLLTLQEQLHQAGVRQSKAETGAKEAEQRVEVLQNQLDEAGLQKDQVERTLQECRMQQQQVEQRLLNLEENAHQASLLRTKAEAIAEDAERRATTLQKELTALVTDYEELVKQGIEAERERDALERTVDALRENVEALEVRLSEERMRLMGRRTSLLSNTLSTNGVNGAAQRVMSGVALDDRGGRGDRGARIGEMTTMSVIRSEFKKMMREARAEHFQGLKAEQEERRRLEAVIRSLKKERNRPTSDASALASQRLSAPSEEVTNT